MRVKTPRSINWPKIPEEMPEEMQNYFKRFQLILDDLVRDVNQDISNGNISFKIDSSAPTADDLNEGELFHYDDSVSVRRLYTRINGALRYMSWT